ncbi:MAG: hypothetical protein BroJett025_08650 [Patescibacteria group bacterium]|nr:MAG: hypothetical protein BroJett025_08650 [Patescibacteria group bacterium]
MKKISFRRHTSVVSKIVHSIKKPLHSFKKIKHSFVDFLGDVHHVIQRNKLLSNEYFTRIVVICFFLGINMQLLPYFLKTTRVKLPEEILNALDSLGVIDKEEINFDYIPVGLKDEEPSLDPQLIFEKLNSERDAREKEPFGYSEKLASAAAELLAEAEKYEFEIQDKPFVDELKTALEQQKYNYEHVSHNMVVGPLLEDGVIDAWLSSEAQVKALFDDDFQQVGIATKVIKTKYNETLGVTVQILGTEFAKKPASSLSQTISSQNSSSQNNGPSKSNFPPISNEEVFTALNSYRQAHGVHNLNVNGELCTYAEKRIQDLVAFGTLDNHEGFKNDFADKDNLPDSIRQYPGNTIAENLAYQHCRNMTTGENFIAQTGTALIEWCFDSSTMGHREAQLSIDFNDACVRSAQGMFVIIFGGK